VASVAGAIPTVELNSPLRRRQDGRGVKFGAAAAAPVFQNSATLFTKLASEAEIFVPENHLKWVYTEPQPNTHDFTGPDSIIDFATRHAMLMHGHTLVWHQMNPDWVTRLAGAAEARAALERRIETVVSRYRGKVWAWDIVNEPVEPEDGLEHGYRNSLWYRLLGIDYVDLSFRLARAADPVTPLCLNEYGVEYATESGQRRRQAMLGLLQRLREVDTPVDCLGLQSHLSAHQVFERTQLTAFLRSVVALGYRLMITELDVNDAEIAGDEAERDAAVARHVGEYLDIVFAVATPLSLSTWGMSDRYSWLSGRHHRADGRPLRPLPLDRDFNRKPLWSVLAQYV
jgi:endo-1,4-beta-xylanase